MIEETLWSQVKNLSPAERLELIGAVWETLDIADVPISDIEKAFLDARMEDEITNPQDASPWSKVEQRLRQRLR